MDENLKIDSQKIIEYCEKKGIDLQDDVKKKIQDTKEIKPEDLATVSGGCKGCIPDVPDAPVCKKCGSTKTKTILYDWNYEVRCSACGAIYNVDYD